MTAAEAVFVAVLFCVAAGAGATIRGHFGQMLWHTAALNIAGAFALGLLNAWTGSTLTVIGVGGLGSLTTFSTLIADTFDQADSRRIVPGLTYVVVSLAGGISAAWLGIELSA